MSATATTLDRPAAGTAWFRGRGLLPVPFRSPGDQPPWARPALLAVAALAATVYAWGLAHDQLHVFYAPAVKSMSESWKALLYGGFDPAASITLDKLPGAFMVEAVSARIFGFHVWSVILPQVVESVVTILVLYRVVRRWRGPVAGLLAAAAFGSMPIVAALARAEISDTLLVMLLVLAADACMRAVRAGSPRTLLLAGVWVGLAFQTKMVQAWAVVPALALVYLLAAPVTARRRLAHVGLFGAATVAVSFVWIGLVLAAPAADRPYIDGSLDNNPLAMVFEYNGLGRFGVNSDSAVTFGPAGPAAGNTMDWHFMLGDAVASQVGWLYPAALIGLIVGITVRDDRALARRGSDKPRDDRTLTRRRFDKPRGGWPPRIDAVRAGFVMWGLWLAVHVAAFSLGRVAHTYYVVATAPAVAALFGGGLVSLWSAYRAPGARRWLLPATVAATVAWAVYLSRQLPDFLPWLAPLVLGVGAAGTAALVAGALPRGPRHAVWTGAVLAVVSMLLVPAAWTASTVERADAGNPASPAAGPAARMGFGAGMFRGARGFGGGSAAGGFRGTGLAGGGDSGRDSGGAGSDDRLGGELFGDGLFDGAHGGSGNGGAAGARGPEGGAGGGLLESGTRRPGAGGNGGRAGLAGGATAFLRGTGFGSDGRPSAQTLRLVAYLKAHQPGSKYLLGVQGSTAAGQFVLAGVSVLPMGGFTGSVPFPTPNRLAALVSAGQLRYILLGGGFGGFGGRSRANTNAARIQAWVTAHCSAVNPTAYGGQATPAGGTVSTVRAGSTGRTGPPIRAQSLYSCAP